MLQPYKLMSFFLFTICSCTLANQKHEIKGTRPSSTDTSPQPDIAQKLQRTATSDTLTIDSRCAVFYQPDSLQIEKRVKEVGEESFRVGADDYMYYLHLAIEYLKNQKLPIINAKDMKYVQFMMADEKAELIKLDTLQDLWGMYLFTPKQAPHFTDILTIEDEYKAYFK